MQKVIGDFQCLGYIGKIKNVAFFQTRKISKIFKNAMKNLYFLKILKEILRFFEKILKLSRNLSKNLGENLENFGNMHL